MRRGGRPDCSGPLSSPMIKRGFLRTQKTRSDDVLSPSVPASVGALGRTYVNPHGVVSDLITLTSVRNCAVEGSPSEEFSWFPG